MKALIAALAPNDVILGGGNAKKLKELLPGCRAGGAFYDETGTIRDVVQNHLFQVLANLAMEPPVRTDSESIRDEKVEVLKAIPPLDEKSVVRGQFRGYRKEKGVAPDSKVETFAALRLDVNSWRWQGVPFYIAPESACPLRARSSVKDLVFTGR